ncbi:hypothetical protein [Nocardia sp. NPDC005366]|uniref:hypothetical protein n=1 Tax=Nocardia sp. NPDC005366 TaxID=3156878 RepID=UPI0033B16F4E
MVSSERLFPRRARRGPITSGTLGAVSDDPDEESGIRIRTGDGAALPALTDRALNGLLGATVAAERPFLEMTRADEWIRAGLLPDEMYRLTHGTGATADEFELYTGDLVLLRDIMFAWIDRDSWWSKRVAWSRIDPAIAELESARAELTEFVDGFGMLDTLAGTMDDALARADELLAGTFDTVDPPARDASVSRGGETGAGLALFGPGEEIGATDIDDPFARMDALLAMDLDDPDFGSPIERDDPESTGR